MIKKRSKLHPVILITPAGDCLRVEAFKTFKLAHAAYEKSPHGAILCGPLVHASSSWGKVSEHGRGKFCLLHGMELCELFRPWAPEDRP